MFTPLAFRLFWFFKYELGFFWGFFRFFRHFAGGTTIFMNGIMVFVMMFVVFFDRMTVETWRVRSWMTEGTVEAVSVFVNFIGDTF